MKTKGCIGSVVLTKWSSVLAAGEMDSYQAAFIDPRLLDMLTGLPTVLLKGYQCSLVSVTQSDVLAVLEFWRDR